MIARWGNRLGDLWLGVFVVGLGCDTPGSPVPPGALPTPVDDPLPVVSQCENVDIRAGVPRRLFEGRGKCFEEYEVDFEVEARPADTMLLDMFQSHMLWNWRVDEREDGTVRHEFALRMQLSSLTPRSDRPGIRRHEPIVIRACPEGDGEGPVLACTTTHCGIYENVSEVPPLMPAVLDLAVSTPPDFSSWTWLREGETVVVPVTVRVYRPLPENVRLELELRGRALRTGHADLEVTPAVIDVGGAVPGTRTLEVSVHLKRFDYEGYETVDPREGFVFLYLKRPSPDQDLCLSASDVGPLRLWDPE